ncbi:hypothetical protein GGF42_001679, partial [Coemansia sp. RSA 2424]
MSAESTSAATVLIEMDEPYVQGILQSAIGKYAPLLTVQTANGSNTTASAPTRLMHWREYEKIDWDAVHRSTTVFASAY